jgi:fatty acid elongase 3
VIHMFQTSYFWDVWCDPMGKWSSGAGAITYYLYINYLLKYVELADTFFLVLRGKPTPVLHVYHHAATLILCLTQLRGQTSLQWLVVVINVGIHIVMYLWYCLHALGFHVWWKKYVTIGQIAQFVIVVGCCSSLYFTVIPAYYLGFTDETCHGSLLAQNFGMFILSSYLVLFIKFYKKTYKND